MSFSQLNFGQLLHELNNVDTKHKIRFYEKIKKRIPLTNYGIYFNQLYIYIWHSFRQMWVNIVIFIAFWVHQIQLQKVPLNRNCNPDG